MAGTCEDLGKDVQKIKEFLSNIKKDLHERGSETDSSHVKIGNKRSCRDTDDKSKLKLEALEQCLKDNEKCHSLLRAAECCLVELLEDCRKELREVNENICFVDNNCVVKEKRSKGHMMFAIPYFKDKDGFPCRSNKEVAWMQAAGYFNPHEFPRVCAWTEEQKRTVENAIREAEIERWVAVSKNAGTSNVSQIPSKSLEQLVGLRWAEYDWLKISVTDLKNARSPHECRSVWFNYLHPQINKKKWNAAEDKKLLLLVEKHNHQDWDSIAEELNTQRSAYQCVCHYWSRLHEYNSIPWDDEDNEKLIKYVRQFRVGHYIPWSKIAVCFEGRKRTSIYRHWRSLTSEDKKGKFSEAEDVVIVAGLKHFGRDFKRIAQFMPNRNSSQVRSRVLRLMRRQRCPGPWQPDEDLLIMQLVERYGWGSWTKISQHFINRDNQDVRHRCNAIRKRKRSELRRLGPGVRPKQEDLNMEDLWHKALTALQTVGERPEARAEVAQLSKLLLAKQKAGRKKGQVKQRDLYDKMYYNFFSCAYVQRGGRGKLVCSKEKAPGLAREVSCMLQIFGATLQIPHVDVIDADPSILDLDKSVLKCLQQRRELHQEQSSASTDTEESATEDDTQVATGCSVKSTNTGYLCPPNYTTLVGFRTLLLSRHNLVQQSKGSLYDLNETQSRANAPAPCSKDFLAAKQRFMQRLMQLFTWPAILSKNPPGQPFRMDNVFQFRTDEAREVARDDAEVENKKKQFGRKKFVARMKQEQAKSKPKEKRPYVRSGKYIRKTASPAPPRKSERISRTSQQSTDNEPPKFESAMIKTDMETNENV